MAEDKCWSWLTEQRTTHTRCYRHTSQTSSVIASISRYANGMFGSRAPTQKSHTRWNNHRPCTMSTFVLLILLFGVEASAKTYLNKWAVLIKGGPHVAEEVAMTHGFRNLGQIGGLKDYYLFEHHLVSKRSTDPSDHHHSKLHTHPQVSWVEQQTVKKRVKRDLTEANQDVTDISSKWNPHFKDPQWPKMWYLHGGASGGYDMGVRQVWERGYTGRGVVITILDDGIEHTHSDLVDNYDPDASKDINGGDKDPMPRYNNIDENRHGTRCAGEVAATANNTACSVGIAYRSSIGGVRMLDGDVSDYIEAQALSLNPNHIDIYSASWGPDDNGMVVDGPAKLAREAFLYGILKGRNNKGSIYVWASGNGGANSDSCSCDGYTNSIFTLSVSSASEHGKKPWYLEECSSTLVTTYSSGDNYGERKIVTTDLRNRCTEGHTGTSASAPLAAGMFALALEANPNLTWRDVQYIAMLSARTEPLYDGEWVINGVGRKVSHKYGYGLLDGLKMVELAERWTRVPDQHICQSQDYVIDKPIEGKGVSRVTMDLDGCAETDQIINHLEHVQAKITLLYSRRGQLQLHLISPNGTRSTLLPQRKKDTKRGQFKDWPFMSVFYWGEQPTGTWTLEIENTGNNYNSGTLVKWQLILYGTQESPIYLQDPISRHPTYPDHRENIDNDMTGSSSDVDEPGYVDYGTDSDSGKQVPGVPCHSECDRSASCWGTEASDCEVCRHMRLGIDGVCISSCPENTYLTEEINVCLPCPQMCSLCHGPDPDSDCIACVNSLVFLPSEGACVAECPSGMFQDINNSCEACDSVCRECVTDPGRCLVCVEGYELVDQHCLRSCDLNQYRDLHGSCVGCDEGCVTCSGPRPNHCLLCPGDHIYYNGTCITNCNHGYYIDDTTEGRQCKSCHPVCEVCSGPGPDQCTTCIQSLKLVNTQCQEDCPHGQYEAGDNRCEVCHGNCVTCKGPASKDCLSCSIGMFLEFGHCVFRCQDGYYDYVAVDGVGVVTRECRDCHRSCATCDGGSQENCTTCKEGLLLSGGGWCTSHCASFEYLHGSHRCVLCHDSCLTCAGPGPRNCTSCTPDLVLLHTHCVTACPESHYTKQQQCHRCHFSCTACIGPSSDMCLSCEAGLVLTTAGRCVRPVEVQDVGDCGTQQYYNPHDGTCNPCDISCDTCDGPGRNHCLSCWGDRGYHAPSRQCTVCCTRHVQSDCCTCSKPSGLCVEYHHHHPVITARPRPPSPTLITRPHHTTSSTYPSTTTKSPGFNDSDKSHGTNLWPGFVTTIVCLCIFILVLFLLLFGLLQAKSNEKLCWRSRYTPVPTIYQNGHSQKVQYKNGTTKVPLSPEDFVDEDDMSSA